MSNVDKWVQRFSKTSNTPTDDRAEFQQKGLETFPQQPERNWKDTARDFKDISHQVGMGLFAAPAKIATGALGLVSPGAADAVHSAGNKFKSFQEQNAPGGASQLSEKAKDTAFWGGEMAFGAATGTAFGKGPIATSAAAGGLAGLSTRQIGDSRTDVLGRLGLGAAAGLATGAVLQAVPAAGSHVKGKLSKWFGNDTLKAELNTKAVDAVNEAFKSEIKPLYKKLGITVNKMTPDEVLANQKFIDSFTGQYKDSVNQQFKKALDNVPAPPEVVAYFNQNVTPKTMTNAKNFLYKSLDQGAEDALNQPGTMKYYEELRQAINDMTGGKGKANAALAGKANEIMQKASPDYAQAMEMFNTKNNFATNLGKNLYKSIRSDNVAKITPLAQELTKTTQGAEVVKKTFMQGMRGALIENNKLPPLEQLQKALGRNPAEIENTLGFLRSTGQVDIADKFEALVNFTSTVSKVGAKNQTVAAKMINKSLAELETEAISDAVMSIMDDGKFSGQFNKVMQEQADHLIRSEKILNIISRAAKATRKKVTNVLTTTAPIAAGKGLGSVLQNNTQSTNEGNY